MQQAFLALLQVLLEVGTSSGTGIRSSAAGCGSSIVDIYRVAVMKLGCRQKHAPGHDGACEADAENLPLCLTFCQARPADIMHRPSASRSSCTICRWNGNSGAIASSRSSCSASLPDMLQRFTDAWCIVSVALRHVLLTIERLAT